MSGLFFNKKKTLFKRMDSLSKAKWALFNKKQRTLFKTNMDPLHKWTLQQQKDSSNTWTRNMDSSTKKRTLKQTCFSSKTKMIFQTQGFPSKPVDIFS